MKRARLAASISQGELSFRTRVQQPHLSAYESGRMRPSQAMADHIAAAIGRPVLEVFPNFHQLRIERSGRFAAQAVKP